MIPIHRKRRLQPLSRSLPSLSVSIRDGETLSAAGSHGSPGLAPARLAADGGRLPTVGLGVEGRDQGRHLLHNVRLLRQPLPARRFPSPSTSSSAAVHGAVSPAAVVVDSGHLLLLLPSAAVRRRRRRLLLPSAGKHLLQNAAAAQPLPTLLPLLLLQPPSTLRLQFRRCSLELLLHLHVLLHPSLPLLPRVGDPFSLPSLNAPPTLPETSLLALPIPSDRSQNAPGAAVKAAAAGAAEEGKKEGETMSLKNHDAYSDEKKKKKKEYGPEEVEMWAAVRNSLLLRLRAACQPSPSDSWRCDKPRSSLPPPARTCLRACQTSPSPTLLRACVVLLRGSRGRRLVHRPFKPAPPF
ncbi:hypothetical protein BHM03_00025811 [Ensete ventricosum]|nr:hypothetical protein BHM03_00025811 [Ensete ventricosum]